MTLLRCFVVVGWMFCCVVVGAQGMGSVSGNVIEIGRGELTEVNHTRWGQQLMDILLPF